MSRFGWVLVGFVCGVVAIYFRRRPHFEGGLSSLCLDCGVRFHYAHPSQRLLALGCHQLRCPVLSP